MAQQPGSVAKVCCRSSPRTERKRGFCWMEHQTASSPWQQPTTAAHAKWLGTAIPQSFTAEPSRLQCIPPVVEVGHFVYTRWVLIGVTERMERFTSKEDETHLGFRLATPYVLKSLIRASIRNVAFGPLSLQGNPIIDLNPSPVWPERKPVLVEYFVHEYLYCERPGGIFD